MTFETLKELCLNEVEQKYAELFEEIKTDVGLNRVLSWYDKTYVKNPEKKLTKFLENRKNKEIEEINKEISSVEKAPDFKHEFVITIEWIKSRTWGANPVVYASNGFEHKGISGCGYDKTSTATGYALNSNLSILKLLYQKKEDELNKIKTDNPDIDVKNGLNRAKLGYGSGYSILPYFEGGVGISSHERILNNIGLYFNHIVNTKNNDVFIVKKIEEE